MAFSATVRNTAPLSPGLKMTVGDWSGSAGDAAGTLDVSGGYVVGALFFKMDAQGNTSQIFPNVGLSTTASVTTITVQNQDNVTTGRFIIIHGGS
jgi:hypothetical protein